MILFCKRPQLHFGKQRLAKEIGANRAFAVSQLLLEVAIEDLKAWQGDTIIAPNHVDEREWALSLIKENSIEACIVLPQPAGNMGERIDWLHKTAQKKSEPILFIGSDAPAMTPEIYREASLLAQTHDIVLTPASDGGVTLMGATKEWANLATINWGSETVFYELLQTSQSAGYSVGITQECHDLDYKKDLLALPNYLKDDIRPARQKLLRWIEQNAD